MTRQRMRKAVSLILTLCLLVALIPAPVFAQTNAASLYSVKTLSALAASAAQTAPEATAPDADGQGDPALSENRPDPPTASVEPPEAPVKLPEDSIEPSDVSEPLTEEITDEQEEPNPKKPGKTPRITQDARAYATKSVSLEQVAERTATGKTFTNEDGTATTYIYFNPIHYRDSNGSWRDIDNTLTLKGDGKTYTNAANDYRVSLPKTMGGDNPLKFTLDDAWLELAPLEGNYEKSAVQANAILYEDVLPDVDVQYSAYDNQLKQDIILNAPGTPTSFSYRIETNLYLEEVDGKIFCNPAPKAKEPLFILNAPYMEDKRGEFSEAVGLTMGQGADGTPVVTVVADATWLNQPERAYPVRIDPTIYLLHYGMKDTCVEQGSPGVYTDNSYSYIGYDDGIKSGNNSNAGPYVWPHQTTRTYMQFDLPVLPPNQTVKSAELKLFQYTAWSQAPRQVDLFEVTTPYDIVADRLDWNKQVSFSKNLVSSTIIDGDIRDANGEKGVYRSWDVAGLLDSWYANPSAPQYGIVLQFADEGAQEQCEVFWSANTIYRPPYLEITHETVEANQKHGAGVQ